MSQDRILPGVALMIAFTVVAPLLDVMAKLASASVAVGPITTARFLVQGIIMAPVVLWMGHSFRLTARAFWLTVLRAAFLIVSTFAFVSAIAVMPLADALAIAFSHSFVLMFLGWALFGEAVGPRRIAAALAAFVGAMLVIRPSFADFGVVAIYPLGTAFGFACYMLVTRFLSRELHPVPMQFHTAALGTLICLPVLALGQGVEALRLTWPDEPRVWVYLIGVGAFASVSHMCITYALKFAPSATLAPLAYLEIVAGTFFGYVIFGDFPSGMTWAGIAIIVASGLYVIHRERVTARQSPVEAPR